MLDDTTPLQDYSGFNRTATTAGTIAQHPALVTGAAYASIFSNTATASFSSPVFVQGKEAQPFTLEAWILPLAGTAFEQKILSHATAYDGIVLEGTNIAFTTQYSTTGESITVFDIGRSRAVHVVGVHTLEKNSLFVDGQLVDEMEIDDLQQADTYAATGNLVTGTTTGTQNVAVNGVAVYSYALSPQQILDHFEVGRDVVLADQIPEGYDAVRMPIYSEEADIFSQAVYDTGDEWNTGIRTNTEIVDGILVPQFDENDTSLAGTWLDSFLLDVAGTTSVYGVTVDWEAAGATIEVSVDGTTWIVPQKNKMISIVPNGYDPTDKVLDLRVTFPGGILEDESNVSKLTVTGFLSNVMTSMPNRVVTLGTPAVPGIDAEPIEYREDAGVNLAGGSLTIGPDTADEPIQSRTIEMWVKRGASLSIPAGGTTYVNGVAGALPTTAGRWSLVHITFASPFTTNIVISGDSIVSNVVLYEAALSTADMLAVLASYTGRPVSTISDTGSIAVTSADSALIYAHDWNITPTG